jgi:hypothetical protein
VLGWSAWEMWGTGMDSRAEAIQEALRLA